jgi:MATE family, multidrug efflux pump
MIEIAVVLGLAAAIVVAVGAPWIVRVFTSDAAVRHLAEQVLWIVAAVQPVAAVVFVLDGVLIGAGDAGYLAWAMLVATVAVFLPLALVVDALDAGLLWLWGAIAAWIVARLVGVVWRFADGRWAVTGATR